MVFLKSLFKKVKFLKINQQTTDKHTKYHNMQRVITVRIVENSVEQLYAIHGMKTCFTGATMLHLNHSAQQQRLARIWKI